ncbi:GNAT family N-acetyltransferase [Roseiconus lacunae]|uniref:GNAT family N-acetyltransferase n=1 Tax=Roseiconus lacunae TaxID=2605694 RepID=UPI001E30C548|nr:GNAT family N-acetyltransferase [Roseiconus lacunae]MCD0457851.1 GNAT family N-acetyltransferase [Roseiconus lacunae]
MNSLDVTSHHSIGQVPIVPSGGPIQTDVALPAERAATLALLFQQHSTKSRAALFRWAGELFHENPAVFDGLFRTSVNGQVSGAIWAQPGPGNQATVWLPEFLRGVTDQESLAKGLVEILDIWLRGRLRGLSFLSAKCLNAVGLRAFLELGYWHLADMSRMAVRIDETSLVPEDCLEGECRGLGIRLTPYQSKDRTLLINLSEAISKESLDCPALSGIRDYGNVVDSQLHRQGCTPSHWRIVWIDYEPIGAVLVSTHNSLPHAELVFLGIVPAARGRGIGRQLIRHAKHLAATAKVQSLSLNCDNDNFPAISTYQRAGFQSVGRSAVFVKQYE